MFPAAHRLLTRCAQILIANKNTNAGDAGSVSKVSSYISFNSAGEFRRIAAPEKDVKGNPYDCGKNCFLNLYFDPRNVEESFSSSGAIGMMAGSGTVGEYRGSYDATNTYLTEDGGVTWREVRRCSLFSAPPDLCE